MAKRLILLLDGTWNDWESGDNDTNIVRLEDLIVSHLERVGGTPEKRGGQEQRVHAMSSRNRDNFVFYQRGVGTGYDDKFAGGVFGEGLAANIRRAYKFLSFYYEPGDQIFVFGFSRGAYTARSLVGYVHAAGLLKSQCCTAENEEAAWRFYRTQTNDRLPGDWAALTPYMHDRDKFRIDCIGVFDTVGALGIPLEGFDKKNRQLYAFHDVALSSITDVNLHAMAIDEQRKPFAATLWRRPKYKKFTTATEQVWFAGVHADIGGGYVSAEKRRLGDFPALDEVTLDWMLKRLKYHYPDFPVDPYPVFDPSKWSRAPQHNSRDLKYWIFPLAFRAIANLPIRALRYWQSVVSYDRRDEPIGEFVHISAIQRLGWPVLRGGPFHRKYRPANLLSILPKIDASYASAEDKPRIRIIDWNGHEMPADAALKEVQEARIRLGLPQPSPPATGSGSSASNRGGAIRS